MRRQEVEALAGSMIELIEDRAKSTGQVLQSNILERSGPPLVRNTLEANVSFGREINVSFFLLSQRLAGRFQKAHNRRC